nr:CRISPR-associated protein, Csm1 family [Anaerophaga thermohalophila]
MRNEKSLSDVWQDLFDRRNAAKRHRYPEELINNYDKFFLPGDSGGETLRDAVTGDELKEEDARRLSNDDDGNEYVSELNWKQVFLGKKLRDAELLVISDGPLTYWSERDFIDPAGLGFCFYFLSKKDVETRREELQSSADKVKIISLKADANGNCDFLNTGVQGYNNVFGFDFLGGNDFPKDEEGYPLTFDKLAGKSDFKRLGYLRMDVDNLGMIFRSGLPKEMITLSRYAALSRNLDWFFKGYINTIWKEKYHQDTSIIYSGGDDLFLIGRWDKVLEFGNDIRKSFKKYVCFNPSFSLSGGIAIVPGKYPVKKASVDSEIMEKRAKSHFYENNVNGDGSLIEKAAITVLGIPLNWDNEYDTIEGLKDILVEKLTQKDNFLPKSFITKIETHHSMALRSGKSEAATDDTSFIKEIPPKVKWMMAYDFGRMAYRMKDNDVKNLVKQCQRDIFSNTINNKKINTKYHSLELWNLAARLAELQMRTQNTKNKF